MADRKPPLTERLKALFAEYGQLAIVIYLVLFVVVLAAFALAIRFGVKVEGTAGTAGTLGAAWLATKLTQPLRIAAALALTPVVAALRTRLRGGPPREAAPEVGSPPASSASASSDSAASAPASSAPASPASAASASASASPKPAGDEASAPP